MTQIAVFSTEISDIETLCDPSEDEEIFKELVNQLRLGAQLPVFQNSAHSISQHFKNVRNLNFSSKVDTKIFWSKKLFINIE